ncbi:MAG: hypothetical protein FJY11_02345 [Bacteroidetes bacterium]|nr:hypothetical protein [Bacteroidota bacterium]
MTGFIYRNRIYIIAVSVLVSVAGALLIPFAGTDPDVRNYVPATLVSRRNTDLIERSFGVQDIVMVLFRNDDVLNSGNLERISSVTNALNRLEGVRDAMSVSNAVRISGEGGFMNVAPALPFIPARTEELTLLRAELAGNPLVSGSLVSDDFTVASVIVYIDQQIPEEEILASIDSLLASYRGDSEVLTGGLPVIRKAIMDDVRRDGMMLVPLALLIMIGLLRLSFRDWRGVLMPFSVVLLSMAFSMGLAPLLGWELSILSLLNPIMMIAVANNYGIHLVARYQEIDHSDRDRELTVKQIICRLLTSLRRPVVFTGLTTIAGILGLLTHSIMPARHIGVLTAMGVGYALLLSLLFIPAWMSYLPRPVMRYGNYGVIAAPDGSSGFLNRLAAAVTARPGFVLIVSAFITVILGSGIIFLKVDSNQENMFPAGHPAKEAAMVINQSFGGSQSVSVMVEGDILNPQNMRAIDDWCRHVENEPGVGNVMSVASVVREMSKALFEPDEEWYDDIPDTREALAQMVELFNMSADPEDFEQIVDLNYSRTLILVRFSDASAENIRNVVAMSDGLAGMIDGVVVTGGYAFIMEEFAGRIVRGQVSSIIFAMVVIFILLAIIFRSLKEGIVALLPLLASVAILLGIMGWAGIALDPATALLSSVMIGIGIDYTIHYIWRHDSEVAGGLSVASAAGKAISTTGRGIVFNALSVMAGFSVLVFSGFTSIRFFGYLVIISIGVCLLAALITVPAMKILMARSADHPGKT